jgi:hypothetical protein
MAGGPQPQNWWGEAPERLCRWPQREITARRVFRHIGTVWLGQISGFDSVVRPFGSLAPPNLRL